MRNLFKNGRSVDVLAVKETRNCATFVTAASSLAAADRLTRRDHSSTTVGKSCFDVGRNFSAYCLHGGRTMVSAAAARRERLHIGNTMRVISGGVQVVP